MIGYKAVYDTRDLTDLTPIYFPDGKDVLHPFTTITPPKDVAITGFDFNTRTWQYIEVVKPAEFEKAQEENDLAQMEIGEIVSQIVEKIGGLE